MARKARKSHGRKTAHQSAFSKASKQCKGKPLAAFRACVRSQIKK